MERHTPRPTHNGRGIIGNIDPRMHPATLASKIARSAPNWEQLSGIDQSHHAGYSKRFPDPGWS